MPPAAPVAERPTPAVLDSLSYDPAVLPLLTPRLRALLDGFLGVLARTALGPSLRTEVHGFHDPEEDTDQIVVRQHVRLSPSEASERLAAVGQAVEAWMDTLPLEDRALFVARIAYRMRRDGHAHTV